MVTVLTFGVVLRLSCTRKWTKYTNSMAGGLIGNLIVLHMVKKFLEFYETRKFITVFKITRHWFLSQTNPIHCNLFLDIVLIFPSSCFFTFFSQNSVCSYRLHSYYMPRPSHLTIIIIFGDWNKSWSSSILISLCLPVTSTVLDPSILPNAQFSNTLHLFFP
jgi:hypothetical protein